MRVIRAALSDCSLSLLRGLSEDACLFFCSLFGSKLGGEMKLAPLLEQSISQAEFAQIIGVSEARVSQLVSDGVLHRGETAAAWLAAYCERLRDQAAGRLGETMGLDLVQERAALAREQRIGQEIKNAVARKEYAPVGLLADVLGMASSAVVDRFDQVEGMLRKSCPDLPDEAKTVIQQVLADARNAWIKDTSRIVGEAVDALLAGESGGADDGVDLEVLPA